MIWLDVHEPQDLHNYLAQSYPVERHPLNTLGFADILWHTPTTTEQMERKKAPELLSSLDHVEEQLRRQIFAGAADKLRLVVEGMIAPDPSGCATYEMAASSKVMYKTHTFKRPYRGVMAWFSALEEQGVEVYIVPNTMATALLVAAIYARGHKPPEEHTTFSKYIKPKPFIRAYDPYVLTIMGVESGGVGEEMGRALIASMATPIEVFHADQQRIANTPLLNSNRRVGQSVAARLIKALGRTV